MTMLKKTDKKPEIEEEKDETLIQIMTISLFIILLAFFILLNSIGVVDKKKQRIVVGSIVENFGGAEPEEPSTGDYPDTVFTDGVSPVDFKDLVAGNDKNLKDITIEGGKARTLLSIQEEVLFKRHQYRLTVSGMDFLKKLAGVIRENEFPVYISCHLDDMPQKAGTDIGNREMTTLRSIRVLRYLIETGHIQASRLSSAGWGSRKPKYSNKTNKTRKMNRRVDFVFVHERRKPKEKGFFIFRDFFFNIED